MTTTTHLRRLLLPLLTVAVVATGCGGDDANGGSDGAPDASTSGAAETTTPAEGRPAQLTAVELRSMAGDTRAVDTGRFEFRVAVDTGGDSPSVSAATVEFSGDDSRATASAEGPGSEPDPQLGDLSDYEIIVAGGQTYLRGQIVATIFDSGSEQWVRLPSGTDPTATDALPIASPLSSDSFLALVEAAEGAVESLGTEEVRGVQCEHLRVVVPAEGLSAFGSEELSAVAPGLLDGDHPLDVWTCDDGYVHKVELSLEASGQATTLSAELYDLGEPLEITAPEGAIDVDPNSLFGGLFSGSN